MTTTATAAAAATTTVIKPNIMQYIYIYITTRKRQQM
jgi:hypothetical protein